MPLMKRHAPSSKHHPYLADSHESSFQKESVKKHSRDVSRSLNNIPAMSSSSRENFIPRSMSAIEENCEGWRLPFCGVIPSSQQTSSSRTQKSKRSSNSESDKSDAAISDPISIPRSTSCNIMCGNETKPNKTNSSPIPVPMRDSRKRKSNSRSSGGYFFDKYMKRFSRKYGFQNKTQGLGHSETVPEIKVSKPVKKRNEVKAIIRSNRQDMLCAEPTKRERASFLSEDAFGDVGDDMEEEDDLYPLRCGSSSRWSTNTPATPRNSLVSDIDYLEERTDYPPLSSVFPSSPPLFWGDCGGLDDAYVQPLSPVSSLTDGCDASCRYSDTNSETLKAMETLYLCNFHVTVEGDWLCLKEICDDSAPSGVLIASTIKDEPAGVEVEEAIRNGDVKSSKEMKVERKNLLGMVKLCIKGLIETSLSAGHTMDSDHEPLQQFFVIIEYILKHGLKTPKNFFTQNKYFWPPLEAVEKLSPSACDITNSVRSLPGIRTHLGKGRAWLRLALMQKKLSDYFKLFIGNKEILREWYEEGALVMNEEAVVLVGHLVGLNCIDANLCMKGHDLDNQVTVIDYSLYMKDGRGGMNQCENDDVTEESVMHKVVNQKNYLEERNRHLETTSSELHKKAELLESTNKSLANELEIVTLQLEEMRNEKDRAVSEKIDITASHQRTLEDREKDLDAERETLRQSRSDLDEMHMRIQKQLEHEVSMRQDMEKELELQMVLKEELEVAMKMLEKDICDKQGGLVTLRQQLDNVKVINTDIYNKLQSKTVMEEKKNKAIEKLQSETETLAKQVAKLQSQLSQEQKKVEKSRFDLVWI